VKLKKLFIINPKAGNPRKNRIVLRTLRLLSRKSPGHKIIHTKSAGHATRIVHRSASHYDVVVSVGGDGTVNEVGKGLIHQKSTMGIIPKGSGNGLARELNIPNNIRKAIRLLDIMNTKTIDTIRINDLLCLNMAGTGFDAEVAFEFESRKHRGLLNYIVSAFRVFSRYKPVGVTVEIDGRIMEEQAFLVSIANSRQFGNNAFIAPLADLEDGYFDICILRPFPLWLTPVLAFMLFNKTIHQSKFYKTFRAKSARIYAEGNLRWHVDGEPCNISSPVDVSINPRSLKVLAS
jgi:YegS/Rv2252/BmrU family lipid kinase